MTAAVRRIPGVDLWMQVVDEILEADHEPGTLFEHSWLKERLGFQDLPPGLPGKRYLDAQFEYAKAWMKVHDELLKTHKVWTRSVPGRGHEVVPPGMQAPFAQQDLKNTIRHGFSKFEAVTDGINDSKLTDEEADLRDRIVAKGSDLKTMLTSKYIQRW